MHSICDLSREYAPDDIAIFSRRVKFHNSCSCSCSGVEHEIYSRSDGLPISKWEASESRTSEEPALLFISLLLDKCVPACPVGSTGDVVEDFTLHP